MEHVITANECNRSKPLFTISTRVSPISSTHNVDGGDNLPRYTKL